jgi:hypothetical protein
MMRSLLVAVALTLSVGLLARATANPIPDEFKKAMEKAETLENAWGVEVDGVQCRLRPDKLVWQVGEMPTFKLDVRNRGTRKDLAVILDPLAHQVVVDKLVCALRGEGAAPAAKPLPPGKQFDDITFRLNEQWLFGADFGAPPPARKIGNVDTNAKLKLTPGRHIVRVAVYADGNEKVWVRTLSNPVEIEIVEPGKKLPPAAVQTSTKVVHKGLALSIRLDKKAFQPEDVIDLRFTLRNVSDRAFYVGDGYLGQDYQEVGPKRHFEIHATPAGEKPLTFWSGMGTEGHTLGIRKVFKLVPGETYDGVIRLSAGAKKDKDFASIHHEERGGSFATKADKRHVMGVDAGRYSIALIYQVDPETHGVHLPPEEFKDQLLWKGSITSEALNLEIIRPPPAKEGPK